MRMTLLIAGVCVVLAAVLGLCADRPVYYDGSRMATVTGGTNTNSIIAVSAIITNPASPSAGDMLRYDGTNWIATSGYVDRGDPAAADFTLGDLTTDGSFHDLDLSSIVPPGAKAVNTRVTIRDDFVGGQFVLRKNGNTNSYCSLGTWTGVSDITVGIVGLVACDTNRVIEYRAASGTWTAISITVLGWQY